MSIIKTLAELNASPRRDENRFGVQGLTTETRYEVGGMGRSWSATHSGAKFHLLRVDILVERPEGYTRHKLGTCLGSSACCNGNGQFTGIRAPHLKLDTDAINCKNCGA